MTRENIKQDNFIEPYSFNTDKEEEWYNIGLLHGVEIAEKELIEKACSTFKHYLWSTVEEPYSFNTDKEEEWYNIGLLHGVGIAEKELIEKACSTFKHYLWSTVEIPKIGTTYTSDAINYEEMLKGQFIDNIVYKFKRVLEE